MKLQPVVFASFNSKGDVTRTVKKPDAWSKVPLYALTKEQVQALERALESAPPVRSAAR